MGTVIGLALAIGLRLLDPLYVIPICLWLAITESWVAGLATALVSGNPFVIAGALFTGGLADGLRRRVRLLRETVAVQAVELAAVSERLSTAVEANGLLKASLSSQQGGLATLYEVFRRLSGTDEAGIVEVVADMLQTDQCSVYRLSEGVLRRVAGRGSAEEVVALGDDLLSAAVVEKELRTLRDFPLQGLTGLRLMAAPILDPTSGQCLGAISVESMPFVNFTRPSAELLETIAELAGRTLAGEPVFCVHDWLGREHFCRRLRGLLDAVGKGTGTPFTLVTVTHPLDHVGERALSLLFGAHLRDTDLRGRLGPGVVGLALLGGAADEVLAGLIADFRFLREWLPVAGTTLEVGHVSGTGSDVEQLIVQARTSSRPVTL